MSEFQVHKLNADGLRKATELAVAFDALMLVIDGLVSNGRERSLVVTKLQEACFFAKRGIAIKPENQE